jgi:hypothetical protein
MTENASTTTLTPEMQQHFAMAFNEPLPAPVNEPAAPAAPPVGEAQVVAPAADAPASPAPFTPPAPNQPINQPAAAEEGVTYIDPNEYIKEHLGFDNWDTAKAEIQRLRALQQNAQTPAEIKYANDQSKRWHEYIQSGKENELREALNARHQVSGIDTMDDAQKVKLFIKMNNPMFDQELIDYQFQQNYGFDDSAFKDDNGVIADPLAYRYAKVAAMQKMQGDLAKANEYFNNYKSKIELPEINQPQTAVVDEAYEGYKARTATATEAYTKTIAPALQALTEADLGMSFNINDPDNQINFDFGITVDKADLDSAKDKSLYFSDWIEETFYDNNGSFQPKKLARAILLERNFDKYVQTVARQAVNAERKRMIERETPGVVKKDFNISQEAKTELDQRMQMAFSV